MLKKEERASSRVDCGVVLGSREVGMGVEGIVSVAVDMLDVEREQRCEIEEEKGVARS